MIREVMHRFVLAQETGHLKIYFSNKTLGGAELSIVVYCSARHCGALLCFEMLSIDAEIKFSAFLN